MIKIDTVRGLVLQTPAFEQCSRFYEEIWGLRRWPGYGAGTDYFAGRGAEPWILRLDTATNAALGSLRLGVGSVGQVEAANSALSKAGVELDGPARQLEGPGSYIGFHFRDPDGRWTEISAIGSPAVQEGTARAERISHIVVNSVNARRLAEFYVSVLGFSISDWYERDYIIFLRCGEDHHSLGFSQAKNCSLNHMAFLVDDQAAVLAATERVKAQGGGEPVWGPGRHGPGGNVFSYFEDPAGFVTEYTAELIQIKHPGEWQAKEWKRTPENGNVWGTGRPSARAIELMEGGEQVDSVSKQK
jgi:catechol 2,3-dioxygenase-like lactoylglutathione lyase family enzyme